MSTNLNTGAATEQLRELTADELDFASAGWRIGPIAVEDGILAIGIPGVGGIFVGGGCIGGWLGGTGVAYCP